MRKESIPVDLDIVNDIIKELFNKKDVIRTSDIIRQYCGGFYSNKGISAFRSFNAQFGKLLKRNEEFLGIHEVRAGVSEKDDLDHPTTTSEWEGSVS
ncbi:MAG: hypothetical protein FVQ84_21200 [Planctomycetes bacterium]|nr:hypothetical protein [Planctomycetota bacterium]